MESIWENGKRYKGDGAMGKRSCFNLLDQINCRGRKIIIKGKEALIPDEERPEKTPYAPVNYTGIYQAMLATQPQFGQPDTGSGIPAEAYSVFFNSMPQVGAIKITISDTGSYIVSYDASLNKLTAGGSA